METKQSSFHKQAYRTPEFRMYGGLAQITSSVGKTSAMADGGSGSSMNKTA